MRRTVMLLLFLCFYTSMVHAQNKPEVRISFSKLYATYTFLQQLSEYYPDNEYKEVFKTSKYHTADYTALLQQFDTLHIYESYVFQGYPANMKTPVMTSSIIERNLIRCPSIQCFSERTFGIVPSSELMSLSRIIDHFMPIYDTLIYLPNKAVFDNQVDSLKHFVERSGMPRYLQKGLDLYNTVWDYSIPFEVAIVPSIAKGGFSAKAFFNSAASEVPLDFPYYDVVFTVLMHEIYHILYDEASKNFKWSMHSWFTQSQSSNSQYAYLLLDEVLATALGNGYVFEQLYGVLDQQSWYNNKYINQMAHEIYPVVKEYAQKGRHIDQAFVQSYIDIYDTHFDDWRNELDNLLTYRYVITDDRKDFDFFRANYRHTTHSSRVDNITIGGLEDMKESGVTKVVIFSRENKHKIAWVKDLFTELEDWDYEADKEFVHTVRLADKTALIIVNTADGTASDLLEQTFSNRRLGD